jgi:hypothetical protein
LTHFGEARLFQNIAQIQAGSSSVALWGDIEQFSAEPRQHQTFQHLLAEAVATKRRRANCQFARRLFNADDDPALLVHAQIGDTQPEIEA